MASRPWQLSKGEMSAIAALVEHETPDKAAEYLRISRESLHEAIRRARKKMGAGSTLYAAVKWDRWAREKQAGKVATVTSIGPIRATADLL